MQVRRRRYAHSDRLPEKLRPQVVLTEDSGKRTTLRFADSGEFVAGDPGGGPPWTLRYSLRRDGMRCLRPQREPGPEAGILVRVPWRCGRRDQPFVAIRRFVPQRLSSVGVPPPRGGGVPQLPEFDWVRHPARTLVWGWTARSGGEVVVTGAGPPQRLRADPGGRRRTLSDGVSRAPSGRGGFVLALDGHVDPWRLRVSIDGRRVDPARTLDQLERPVGREPLPVWRSVASADDRPRSRDPLRAVPGSASITRRADDPAGGPGWALRSWSVRMGVPPDPVDLGRPSLCFAIGVEQRGRLVEPVPSGGTRMVGMGVDDRRCPRRSELAAGAADFELRTYVDDADASDPRAVRVVVAGLLGDAARSAELLGAGAPRALALGRHGTFLVILGPEYAGRMLRVRARGPNGVQRTTSALQRMPFLMPRCVPTPGQSIRVADPDGGPSWTTGRGRADGRSCRYTGRAIGERVATLLEGRNWVLFEPASTSILYTRRPRTADRPLALNITDPRFAMSEPPSPLRSAAQVARRTLAGRTIVTGSATDAVTAVTLRTPRDIRTVRPGPGGLLLAVYDGVFYGGDVHAIVHMRDGRTITQTFPIGQFR